MADGDKWSMDRIACNYVADDGGIFRFRSLEAYETQAALGWEPTTDSKLRSLPKGIKPRRALCWDAGNHADKRAVVVATNAAYMALEIDSTTLKVLNPSTDVEDTFTVYGLEGERSRGVERD
jgi:hypothetical protein